MSDYWLSHKRYHCKYCNIYIADDVPSRQHHENGARHSGNVDRFVRGLYKAGEKAIKDKAEEAREIARIDKAAALAYAQHLAGGGAPSSSSARTPPAAVAPTPAPHKPPPKPSNPYANYSTAASLGYTDPDAARAHAEAEMRQTMGVAGQWQFVAAAAANDEHAQTQDRKRDALDDPEDERVFKLRKKTAGVGLGAIYDPGVIPVKVRAKSEAGSADVMRARAPAWNRAAFAPAVDEPTGGDGRVDVDVEVKAEAEAEAEAGEDARVVSGLFRKRKLPARC